MDVSRVRALAFSGAGTTLAVAERFACACGVSHEVADVTPLGARVPAFEPGDLAVFAAPSYGGRVPTPMAERTSRCAGSDTPAVLLVTYGNRAVDDTFLELAGLVRERGFVPVAVGAVVAHHSLMVNVAEGRPDEKDLGAVDSLAHGVMARLSAVADVRTAELADVPGSLPYRDFGGVPFRPETDPAACTSCGTCATQCPTGAIVAADPRETNAELCVSCMRCVAACPAGARRIGGGAALAAARAAFAVRCAARQESYVNWGQSPINTKL